MIMYKALMSFVSERYSGNVGDIMELPKKKADQLMKLGIVEQTDEKPEEKPEEEKETPAAGDDSDPVKE